MNNCVISCFPTTPSITEEYKATYKSYIYALTIDDTLSNLLANYMSETSTFTTCTWTFKDYENLVFLDLSKLDTTNATTMDYLFYNCSSLPTLDLYSFNTSKVTTMQLMFAVCESLKYLDLRNFDTSKVTNMNNMFASCSNLETLYLNNFDTSNVTDCDGMFYNCTSLKNLYLGNNWDGGSNFSDCPLTHDSCLDVFNKLADITTATTSRNLLLSATTKALMSDAEIKIATDKGWTVS